MEQEEHMWEIDGADVWAVARHCNPMARYRNSGLFADRTVAEAARHVHDLRRALREGDVC
jgi:hypothetical protein